MGFKQGRDWESEGSLPEGGELILELGLEGVGVRVGRSHAVGMV